MNAGSDLSTTLRALQDRIQMLLASVENNERIVIALAGCPGSGKSTICAALIQQLLSSGIENVVVIPMDGFHLTKAQLSQLADPEMAVSRRGAPFTFDAEGFVSTVEALRHSPVIEKSNGSAPFKISSFDHAIQDPIEGGVIIPKTTRVVIVEGNYTLLNIAPWNKIAQCAHDKWFVDTPRDVAKTRIMLRHISAGIESNMDAAELRAEMNDLKNADLIKACLITPDLTINN